jgi:hypothetical protein
MFAQAHETLDRQRMREAILAHRIAAADEKSYTKAITALEDKPGASDTRRPLKEPDRPSLAEINARGVKHKESDRVSLAEQARQRARRKTGEQKAHGGA